jgi:hypothetical protein
MSVAVSDDKNIRKATRRIVQRFSRNFPSVFRHAAASKPSGVV